MLIGRLKYLGVLGLCALWVGLIVVGVVAEPKYGGTLVVVEPSEPATLDTHCTQLISTQNVCYQVYETLIAYDSGGEFHPMLATSWEASDDYKSWTLKLRQGVKFHDGTDLTAADVKASILRWSEYSPRRSEIGEIKSFNITNDYEFTIIFSEPNALLENMVAYIVSPLVIMPEELCQVEVGKIYKPIGTGPFKFVEWKPEEEIVLERFDDYWQIEHPIAYESDFMAGHKVAYVDKLIIKYVPELAARLAGLQTGVFHIVKEVALGQYEDLLGIEHAEPVPVSPGWNVGGTINAKHGIMLNRWLRKAILVYIDCEEIMMSVVEGRTDMMKLNPSKFFTEQTAWQTDIGSCYYNVHDEELAKHYLELSGYNGEPIVLMSSQQIDWIYRASIPFLEQLQELGLNVDFQVYDWATVKTRRQDPELWDILINGGGPRFSPTGQGYYGVGYTGYGPEECLAALEKMFQRPLSDLEYQSRLWEIVQATVYIDAGTFHFGEFSLLEGWDKGLESLNKGLNRLGLWNTWWES